MRVGAASVSATWLVLSGCATSSKFPNQKKVQNISELIQKALEHMFLPPIKQ